MAETDQKTLRSLRKTVKRNTNTDMKQATLFLKVALKYIEVEWPPLEKICASPQIGSESSLIFKGKNDTHTHNWEIMT